MSEAELNKIRELIFSKKIKVVIYLKKVKFSLVINNTINVEDKLTGSTVKWQQAFGRMLIKDVLNFFPIEKVILIKNDKEYFFKNLNEVLFFIQKEFS